MTRQSCQTIVLGVVATLLLAGCQVLPPEKNQAVQGVDPLPAVDVQAPTVDDRYQAKVKETARDMSAVCASADLQAYFRHTPCLPMRITEKDCRSKKQVSRYEREAAKKAFERFNVLSAKMREWMKTHGTPAMKAEALRAEAETLPQIEALQIEFLKGALLWGEYNRRRLALYRATQK